MSEEIAAPGWDAIDAALGTLYPGVEPLHYGTITKYAEGGPDPLDGISIYRVDEPVPHWHYVTYGLTELYDKTSSRPERSGYGFELTLRLLRGEDEEQPPPFVWNFLQNLARAVFEQGLVLDERHVLDLNGPIAQSHDTRVTAVGFALDPDLPVLETPNGEVKFLQVLGMTDDELQAARAWDKRSFFELLAERQPKWILDLDRASILDDADTRREVRRRTEQEGSSTDGLTSDGQTVTQGEAPNEIVWTLDALTVKGLHRNLPGRVPFGRSLHVWSMQSRVVLEPGEENHATIREDGTLVLTLTAETAGALVEAVRPLRGRYRLEELPNLAIEVVPSEIKDPTGKVVEVVG